MCLKTILIQQKLVYYMHLQVHKEDKNYDWAKIQLIICYCGINYWPDSYDILQFCH